MKLLLIISFLLIHLIGTSQSVFKQKNKYGLIDDESGEIVLKAEYDTIFITKTRELSDRLYRKTRTFISNKNNLYGFVLYSSKRNESKKEKDWIVVPCEYDTIIDEHFNWTIDDSTYSYSNRTLIKNNKYYTISFQMEHCNTPGGDMGSTIPCNIINYYFDTIPYDLFIRYGGSRHYEVLLYLRNGEYYLTYFKTKFKYRPYYLYDDPNEDGIYNGKYEKYPINWKYRYPEGYV